MQSTPATVSNRRRSNSAFVRSPFSPFAFLLLALFWLLAAPAQAVEGTITLEGCKSDGTPYPPDGPFICEDGAYTTGNLGKEWDELDFVPHRLTIKSGKDPVSGMLAVVVDRLDAGKPGYDRMSKLTISAESDAGCPAVGSGGTDALLGKLKGSSTDVSLFRDVTYAQGAGLTCKYDFYARLAFGSHLFPGSSLHANRAVRTGAVVSNLPELTTSGVGAADVSIPVSELTPPEADGSISAVGNGDTKWTLSKTPSTSSLNLGDVCKAKDVSELKADVQFTVTWTKSAVSGGGNVEIEVKVFVTSFASRNLLVQAKGTLQGGSYSELITGSKVPLPANANHLEVLHETRTVSSAQIGNVGDLVSFNGVTATFFDPVDDPNAAIGTTDPFNVSSVIVKGSDANSTAVISDRQTVSPTPTELQLSSKQSPVVGLYLNGYSEGTLVEGPIDWDSFTQTSGGTVTFTSTIALGERRVIGGLNGPVTRNVASLLASDGFAVGGENSDADVVVSLTSSASVELTITKTVTLTPVDYLAAGQSIRVEFKVEGNKGFSTTRQLTFDAADFDANGQATKSLATAIGNLEPDSYVVTETGAFLIADGTETEIALNDPSGDTRTVDLQLGDDGLAKQCSGTATFGNTFSPKLPRAKVIKLTVPTDPEGGVDNPWTFTLTGPGIRKNGSIVSSTSVTANANDPAGVDFGVDLVKAGTYYVTETLKSGWDLTDVQPSLQNTPTKCTFTISFPQDSVGTPAHPDTGAVKTCTFTNTKRGGVKVIKRLDGALLPAGVSFVFDIRQGATPTEVGNTPLVTGTVTNGSSTVTTDDDSQLIFKLSGNPYFLVPGQVYQLCEQNIPGGWSTSLSNGGFVPNGDDPNNDNSTVCVNFTAQAGTTIPFEVNNHRPPQGDARTIGYWKNHASCASSKGKQQPVTDRTLQAAGDPGIKFGLVDLTDTNKLNLNVASSCAATVRLLDKRDNTGAKRASSPLFNLASQYTAARLNYVAGAGTCSESDAALSSATALLNAVGFNGMVKTITAAQAQEANTLAGQLDDYNNNQLCQ